MKTFIPLFPASPSRNPHDERRKALLQRILAQQAQIEDLIRDNQTANPGLAARARSLLLFHKGASMENIMRVTGLRAYPAKGCRGWKEVRRWVMMPMKAR